MSVEIQEINSLLNTVESEDYPAIVDFLKIVSQNRNRQKALATIAAMNEFQALLNGDKGWASEEEMLKDMAEFRRERMRLNQ